MAELAFDSDEEEYFYHYLNELQQVGVVLRIQYHPKPFLLSDKVVVPKVTVDKKQQEKLNHVFLMHDHEYEYDYKVLLNPAYEGVFFSTTDNYHAAFPALANRRLDGSLLWCVDVKPTFMKDQGANTRFPLNQKWVWQRYGVYVQKIICEDNISKDKLVKAGLFNKTFCPKRYLCRPLKNGKGYLKVKVKTVRTINDYYSTIKR